MGAASRTATETAGQSAPPARAAIEIVGRARYHRRISRSQRPEVSAAGHALDHRGRYAGRRQRPQGHFRVGPPPQARGDGPILLDKAPCHS